MSAPTPAARHLRDKVRSHRDDLTDTMQTYGASNLRFFGSVARGDATETSDIDLLIDLAPDGGNLLMRNCGLIEEFRAIIGHPVDVVAVQLLRPNVRSRAIHEAVPV